MGLYAEIIYETGSKSIAYYESEEQMNTALAAHHARATNGEDGGPTGHPAERVKRVLTYDTHPGDLNIEQTVSAEVADSEIKAALKDLSKDGAVAVHEVAARVRDLSSPTVFEAGRHDSMYKATETGEVDSAVWEGAA